MKFGRVSSEWSADFFKDAWWKRLFTDPDFWQAWIDRYQELREGPLRREHIMEVVGGMFDQLREAEPRERTRWRHYPRSGIQSTNGYTFDFGPREYDSELRFKRQWFSDRLTFIDTNLLSRPIFEPDVPGAGIARGDQRIVSLAADPDHLIEPAAIAQAGLAQQWDVGDERGAHALVP